MIARPKTSRNEWKTAEIGAFEVGNFALLCCPGRRRERLEARRVREHAGEEAARVDGEAVAALGCVQINQ